MRCKVFCIWLNGSTFSYGCRLTDVIRKLVIMLRCMERLELNERVMTTSLSSTTKKTYPRDTSFLIKCSFWRQWRYTIVSIRLNENISNCIVFLWNSSTIDIKWCICFLSQISIAFWRDAALWKNLS